MTDFHEQADVQWFARRLEAQNSRDRQADQAEYEQQLLAMGRAQVGVDIAAEQGLSGRVAEFFAQGFAGVPAQVANPRAEGLEPAFRAGRQAMQAKGAAQRTRAAAALIRHQWSFDDFKAAKYQLRPCPYETPIRGEY